MNSPLGEPYMSPMSAAIHVPREQDHAPLAHAEFDLRQWYINPKVQKLFEPFNGTSETYRNRASRVKDHLMASSLNWRRVLEVTERIANHVLDTDSLP